ncbi:hypothetical protein ACTFIU_011104 [Dictyostelium citrinum]
MSLFKRITNLFAPSQQSNLIECNGYFYHFYKGQWVCLFNDCELVIHKFENYKYQIQVTRIVDQEQENERRKQREAEGLEEEEEEENIVNYFEFPVTNGLELYNEIGPLGNFSLSWKGTNTRFLFEFDSNNNNNNNENIETTGNQLRRILCQCIYESMYLTPYTNGSENEIDNNCREFQTIVRAPLTTNVKTIQAEKVTLPQQQQAEVIEEDVKPSNLYLPKDLLKEEKKKALNSSNNSVSSSSNSFKKLAPITGEELFRCPVSLYLETNNQFNLKDPQVIVLLNKTKPLEYTFYITKEDNVPIFSQLIDSNMFPQFFNEQISFIWFNALDEQPCRWSIKFSIAEEYEEFRSKFTVLHYEVVNQAKFKGKKDDIEYMANILTEDHKDDEILFDTDDGFNAHDLEDFDNLDINESNSVADLLSEHQNSDQDEESEEEEESGEEEEEESGEEESGEEEEEEESGEEESGEEEQVKPSVKNPIKQEPKSDSEEEEEESEEEESEEESEEEESEEESEEDNGRKVFRVPLRKPTTESEEESEEEESEEEESEEEESDSDENLSEDKKQISKDFSKSKNSSLIVGYKDKSYVVRGSTIGVFNTDDDGIKFNTAITNIKQKDGKNFSPKKMMLQQQDQTMLMLNPDKKSNVYKMDLNRPDIVEEWDMNWRNQPTITNSVVSQYKNDEETNNQLFVGYNGNNMFLVDPRESKNKVTVKFHGGSNPKSVTSCAATSGSGQIALGTSKGEIKLFSKTQFDQNKRSSTSSDPLGAIARSRTTLPGIGDPIVGIDVTKDGKWIVATCKQYIMVIPASLKDGSNGFEDRLGARRPSPKRLILKPQDIKRMGGVINFTPAKFNIVGDEQSETSILTSTGSFLITWNFRKIKQNILDVYQIKQFQDGVVAEQFKSNRDNSIVVTFPDNVILSKKK